MRSLRFAVDTLRCEADDHEVCAGFLALEGVLSCAVDLDAERVEVSYDEGRVTKGELVGLLEFFGLTVKQAAPRPR